MGPAQGRGRDRETQYGPTWFKVHFGRLQLNAYAEASAWPALLAALGLEAGEPVRFAVQGLPPIEGEADYVGPSFLGVRTDDALYRFHGRSARPLSPDSRGRVDRRRQSLERYLV